MPDQDTLLEIIESYDLGDYLEMQAEMQAEQEAVYETENDPYADWDPRCQRCGISHSSTSEYCDICSQELADEYMAEQMYSFESDPDHLMRQYWHEQLSPSEAQAITKDYVEIARARADIIQAEADVARITADIAAANREIAHLKYDNIEYPELWEDLSAAEINLVNTETCLVDAEIRLANARRLGSAYESVTIGEKNVEDAEARVQAQKDVKDLAIEIRKTSEAEHHVEESNLLAEGAHIEYIFSSERQDSIVEIGFCPESVHIEYVNSLIELAEAKDALELAEALLTKTPSLSLTHGYGFASHEPRCPTSDIPE